MKEIWKPLKDWEDLYMVSNLGRVQGPRKMLKLANQNGYLVVTLSRNNKHKTCKVHRLVAEMFIENKNNKPQVNHIDENKHNNRVDNLEWSTAKENCNHGTRNKRMGINKGKPVTNGVDIYCSAMEAQRQLGIFATDISRCCLGKAKTTGGFTWSFVEGEEG